jgi:hypothetical protein
MKGKATFKMAGMRAKHWRSAAHLKSVEVSATNIVMNKRQGRNSPGDKQRMRANKLWGRTESW